MPLLQDKKEYTEKYIELLQVVWSLSRLFSDSTTPYLYYRAAENIFCKAFNADNLSRSDCTADARLNWIWYWLKTFMHKNWKALEKVAEFNAERNLYAEYEKFPDKFINIISELRNRRIESTMSIHWINDMIYHCVSRDENKFFLHEEKMDFVDVSKIHNITKNKNAISFIDWLHEYSFNISKSTLFKRFYIKPIYEFEVDIFEDPLSLLEKLFREHSHLFEQVEDTYDQIICLPLYSEQWWINVPEKSWLNQWNAWWRERNENELYIPIPAWIHKIFPQFFPAKDVPFNLYLPDKTVLSAKLCQENNKALMSNPNKALWKRLLRDVLRKKQWEVVTYEDLEKMWVDSVEVAKKWNDYYINFKDIWTFEDFKNENLL
jgi:hypothetical protein